LRDSELGELGRFGQIGRGYLGGEAGELLISRGSSRGKENVRQCGPPGELLD
jgi:hypothetical protein